MSALEAVETGGVLMGHVLPPGTVPADTRTIDQGGGIAIASPSFDVEGAAELLARLRTAGEQLRTVPMADRTEALGQAGERLLAPDDPARADALRLLPAHACLSSAAAREVLDRMASDWTRERLRALVAHEFGEVPPEARFEPAAADPDGRVSHRIMVPSGLGVTICSGTVPGVSVTAAIRSLLVGSGTLLKPGAGDVVLPVLFARTLQQNAPEIAAALAVAYWPGGDSLLEDRALAEADRIVVYGGDDTLRSVRSRASTRARLVEYRHRVGVAVVGVGSRPAPEVNALAEEVTDAIVPYEQRGCVSPVRVHAIGTAEQVTRFGEHLAQALERRAQRMPASRTPEEAAAAQQVVGSLEMRRAAGEAVELWTGDGWAVAVAPTAEMFAGGRVILIQGSSRLDEIQPRLRELRGRLQTVGVAGLSEADEERVALWSARAGASRIGPLREIAYPPPWWVHEGMGPLQALTDVSEWARGP